MGPTVPPAFNIADLFELVADAVPDRVAVVQGGRRLTFGALDERATRLAHALVAAGLEPGDHVGLYQHDAPEFLEAMLACFKLRAVPINVNFRYVADELAEVMIAGDLVAVVHDEELRVHVDAARERVPSVHTTIAVGDEFEALVASGSPARDFGPRSGDDHYVLFTGGTTGRPKGVVWRHEDIFFAALGAGNPGGPAITSPAEIATAVLTTRGQRVRPYLAADDPGPDEFAAMAMGPLTHAGGQWLALGTLLGGGRVVLNDRRHLDPEHVLDLVERERLVMVSLVGDAGARPLADTLDAYPERWDTSSLLLLGSGGAMLAADVKQRLLAGLPSVLAILEAVGSSEAPVQATTVSTRHDAVAPSLHFAARDTTMVVDDDLRPIAPGSGRAGRLATRGRVPIGYHNDPDRSAATFVDIDGARWALPGDMATIDADGTVRLLGRGALCINTGGEKVYPEEVEAVIKAHPAVLDVVVVGVTHERWGEQVVAVVQPVARRGPFDASAIDAHCRSSLAGYKVPRRFVTVDEIRRSPAGKADYPWAKSVASLPVAKDGPVP